VSWVGFDPLEMGGRDPYFLLTALVVPRPIAWVSTVGEDGVLNLAPHSYFNVISNAPMIVHFTSTGIKDTLRNVRSSGEFVVNIVNRELVEKANLTAADFPPTENEFEWAGLETESSLKVSPPRVAAAPAALECTVRSIVSMGNGNMVFGNVVFVHVRDEVLRDGRVDPALLDPVGRLSGSAYSATTEIFKLVRPTYEGLRGEGSSG
jgi:flavin reductase (DIM6/NTAB) family NADH-FMN oxidoreductase RutF